MVLFYDQWLLCKSCNTVILLDSEGIALPHEQIKVKEDSPAYFPHLYEVFDIDIF